MADVITGTMTQAQQTQTQGTTPVTQSQTQSQVQTQSGSTAQNEPEKNEPSGELTVEGLMSQMAELRAQNAQQKANFDKLMQSEANLRKQLRAKQTAEEQEQEAQREQREQHEQYVKGLERFKSITESSRRYLSMGMDPAIAEATAAAEVDGEMDTVTSNLTKFMAERDKKKDEEIRAQYMAQMPTPQSGNAGQVDYSQAAEKAISEGDFQSAALALLQSASATISTP